MVILIKASSNSRQVINRINNIKTRLPKDVEDVGFLYAKSAQRNLRLQLTRNQTVWRKKIWNSIQARRVNKQNSIVVINREGIYLDSMRPHYVKLKRGRLIRQWALAKGNVRVQAIAKRQGSIYVKPHPFIDEALIRTQIKFKGILKARFKRAMAGV